MAGDFMPRRTPKVLRVDWDSEHKSGFQVLGGFRIRRFSQGLGIVVDMFGTRLTTSLWSFRPRDWFAYMKTYGVIQDDREIEPPFNQVRLWLGPFCVRIGPAYGGFLKAED
jgi:hypothetical protein